MTSRPYDIVLLPEPSLFKLACETSQSLLDKKTLFTLKDGEVYPHVSLYMVELTTESVDQVKMALENIVSQTPRIQCTAMKFHQEEGYINVKYKRDQNIDDLQNQIIDVVNPLRNGLRAKDKIRIKTATGIDLENLQKYGYRNVGAKFSPHLTLTRFINEDTDAVIPHDLYVFDGIFTSLAVFELGENGTCVKKLFELPLHQL